MNKKIAHYKSLLIISPILILLICWLAIPLILGTPILIFTILSWAVVGLSCGGFLAFVCVLFYFAYKNLYNNFLEKEDNKND